MTAPKVTLHDVSIEGEGDHQRLIDAVQRAVGSAAEDGPAPSTSALRAGIIRAVANNGGGER